MNTSLSLLSILTLIFLSLSSPCFSAPELCNPKDKQVLLQIKKDLNNPYHLASWFPHQDCCTQWYAVKCDPKTHRITSLTIFSGNISAQIPSAVGNLPYLETLMFRKLTNLTGEIPYALSKLSNLKSISLSWTHLTGPVPSLFSKLKHLNYLDLSFNQLTGSIPPSLSTLTNLEAIHLDRNKLTGTIPDSFGTFVGNVPHLFLSHNQLTGPVPKSLSRLNFKRIDVARNKLEGDISFLFGANKGLEFADFSRNLFEFDLSKVKFPESLGWLDLNHNKIYGSIPVGLTKLELQYLNVSYNRLCGKIPVGGKLQGFDSSEFSNNRCLCGAPLPKC